MAGVAFKEVEIRTWPERADLLVIDYHAAELLAHYLVSSPDQVYNDDISNVFTPYETRAAKAIRYVESDQELLKLHFLTEDSVCLRPVADCRERLEDLLNDHNLTIEDTNFANLSKTAEKFDAMPIQDLYNLLVDWHDVIDRRYPAGSSVLSPDSWVHRATPTEANHFHYLAGSADSDELAYELFRSLIDVHLADFSFGLFIRWVYFHRSEFPNRKRFPLKAIREAVEA